MLVRNNIIKHPLGIELETPLLIPSFSSKGFSFNNHGESEATDALKVSKEFLTESLLVSAYDLYHKHIPYSEEFVCTDLTVIDSGGYETSHIYDLSATSKYPYPIKEWSIDKLDEVLYQWPKHKAAVIVSYDHGTERHALEMQIKLAEELFNKHSSFLSDFLVKPETDAQQYIQIENVIRGISQFGQFAIIGVTEKELGNSILNRMKNISKIRKGLDDANNNAPIHVFGSLDPITSILYFLAGAEIFDGLTWLKYAYFNGPAIYQTNFGAFHPELGIHVRDSQVRSKSIVNNLYFLERMKYIMKEFISTNDFSLFESLGVGISDLLKKSYSTFITNNK